MKKYSAFIASASMLILAGCSEEAPDSKLSVSVAEKVCKAGQPVTFNISGDADNIVFYSGETGHEYGLRDRQYADNDLMVDFVSFTDQSTGIHPNFQVLISDDFNGIYDAGNVAAATWTDVTGEFSLPVKTGTNTPSGEVNLKRYVGQDNEALVYFAFRYWDLDGQAQKNRWVVRSINIKKVSPEGQSTLLADIKTAGWQNVAISGDMKWTLPGSQLLAAGNVNTNDKDAWVVSKGFKLRTAEPSTGVVLKNIATDLSKYQYVYEKPGTYEAVFASTSVWYNSNSSSITTVKVTVTE